MMPSRRTEQVDHISDTPDQPAAPTGPLRGHSDRVRRPVAEQLISLRAPASFAADRYRTLRHTIERLHGSNGVQVIAVTSPGAGEGKSVTALNLAGALAQCREARVLIADADLRQPSVADYLGFDRLNSTGLADAIVNPALGLPDVVTYLKQFNLSVLPAGAPQSAPYELLNSPRLESLLADARRRYDFVVMDTPPLLPFPDCQVLSRWIDRFLLIVAAHRTRRKLTTEALSQLDPARLIGIVFNGDDQPRSSYYGYGDYYDTGNRDRRRGWWQRG